MRSPTYELVQDRLGEDLATWVSGRRPTAWDRIARELSEKVGFYVSHAALSRWFKEEKSA